MDRQLVIIEGIVTTLNADRSAHVAPMGPIVDDGFDRLLLRPYQSSTTFGNLRRTLQGVFHVTDDVELLAHAAVGRIDQPPALAPAEGVDGFVLSGACRWYAFRVERIDASRDRAELEAAVIARGRQRDFVGFNRGKHAVVEAAILATRLDHLPHDEILADFRRLAVLVEKTGGSQERQAFGFLETYVQEQLATRIA